MKYNYTKLMFKAGLFSRAILDKDERAIALLSCSRCFKFYGPDYYELLCKTVIGVCCTACVNELEQIDPYFALGLGVSDG